MTLGALRRELRQILRLASDETDSAHDLGHADRVWQNARDIAAGERLPPTEVLLAAAYLHDLVTLPKDHPERSRSATLSAEAAGPLLESLGFEPSEIAATRHAIEAHSHSAGIEPLSPEARILRDADRLEALGAIGIARCFAVSGALGRPLFDPDDPFASARAPDDGRSALDHFATKLMRLPEGFLTSTGRGLAERRVATMRLYLNSLAVELGVAEPDW